MEKLSTPEPAQPSPGTEPGARLSVAKMAGEDEDNSKLCRHAFVRRWLPMVYKEELYQVLKLTGPLVLSRILDFLLPFVVTVFCGHIGNAELAGYALATAIINVTTSATGYGLAVTCDTLISQTYGSKNMKRVGVVLQRSSLILLLFCLPCWALLINSDNLLLLMRQDSEVVRTAHLYVMAFLPAVPAMFLHQLQVSYLQNQGIILPQMYTAAAANILNAGTNYILIISLDLGVVGSAIANSLSQINICLLLFGYIRWKKLHQQTWGGWSTDCLQEWGSFMKLAIPSALMVCFEWWIWEVGSFLAGVLGEVDLAAQHILVEMGTIFYMIPLGIHGATCVRVGNALGAGDTSRAMVTCKVSLVLSTLVALCQGIIIAGSKSVIGNIFTSDDNIVEIVSKNLTIYLFLQFFDAIMCVCIGILVGSGMQKVAALSNLVAYYCIGLPVGVALIFAAQLNILGFWLGLLICVFLQTSFFLFLIFRLNWTKLTHKAQQRAGKTVTIMPKQQAHALLNEPMVSNVSDCNTTAQLDGEVTLKAHGYCPVNTQDQGLKAGHDTESNNMAADSSKEDLEQSKNATHPEPKAQLSITQLILRRGITLLCLILILAIGVAFHFAFPAPEPSAHSISNFTMNLANVSNPTQSAFLDLTPEL